jgi:MFS family permease
MVKTSWGMGGGIMTLLAVFGERIFPVAGKTATGIGVLFTARGIGTAIGPIMARRWSGETRKQMQNSIGIAFLIGGAFYIAFGVSRSFIGALLFLLLAHMGGSILWVFSTVLLQRAVEDRFRGRVFAAEMALVTLTMAASNYVVGELIDRGYSPRVVTASVGGFFLLPGLTWFLTEKWWDRKYEPVSSETVHRPPVVESVRTAGGAEVDRSSTLSHDPVATAPGSDIGK